MLMHTETDNSESAASSLCVEAIACDPSLDWSQRVRVISVPSSPLKPGEVRLAMQAMTINPADLLQLSGKYGVVPELPYVPGHEGVGVVLEVGPDVTHWHPGQRALVIAQGGYWREERVVPARQLIALDDALDTLQCAMLTANPATAWVMLKHLVELQQGDVVLLNAANSAVGQCIRQLATHWGITTINLVRRASAVEGPDSATVRWLVDDGQDLESLRKQVKHLRSSGRLALALDAVGGLATARLAACVDDGATVAVYGLLSGQDSTVPAHDLVFRDVKVRGFWLARWFSDPANRAASRAVYPELANLLQQRVFEMGVEATYPLDQVAVALAHADQSHRSGKVLLTGNTFRSGASILR